MAFITDKQTLDDLNIFGKNGRDSVYSLFNRTNTRGGALILEGFFRYPLSDADKINQRNAIIRYFMKYSPGFPFVNEWFDSVEHYLGNRDQRTKFSGEGNTWTRKFHQWVGADAEYEMLYKGMSAGVNIIKTVEKWLVQIENNMGENPAMTEFNRMKAIIENPLFIPVKQVKAIHKDFEQLMELDHILRYEGYEEMKKLLQLVYHMDVWLSVAQIACQKGFTLGKALPPGGNVMHFAGIYHPLLARAVPNAIEVSSRQNVIFLTGANMAGKSTFMKTFGIVVYLAHMGFPLPADNVEFSVQQGMYTTINLQDNLTMGYSHFYAEVLRVKKVVEQVAKKANLVIIFDELFRGTNVKDAYDATVAVTEALAGKKNCTFLISTHIIEAGKELKARCHNINYVCLPTVMTGKVPAYTYTLQAGITQDRHGMIIIENEGIPKMLEKGPPETLLKAVEPKEFIADKQTVEDLELLGKFKSNSIFRLFNHTATRGGERLLEEMFKHPLTDETSINGRANLFRFFQQAALVFPFKQELIEQVENYLNSRNSSGFMVDFMNICRRKLLSHIAQNKEYDMLCMGLRATISFLELLSDFCIQLREKQEGRICETYLQELEFLYNEMPLLQIMKSQASPGLPLWQMAKYDHWLRSVYNKQLRHVLVMLYELDVYITVGAIARDRGFVQARAVSGHSEHGGIDIRKLFHPCLRHAVANDICLNHDRNIIFLTGANMAGKSTLMKSFAIAIYLAHMGFPVAAAQMEFTVQEGLYTSINVPDNLNKGYSHFYAEVLRVKQVAKEVAAGKKMVVIFDELFKGTNVKDAYDGTVSITRAFSRYRNCSFLISTHITEAGHALRKMCDCLHFVYLPTVMRQSMPTYTYRLEEGITNDRHGMRIINNEHILEMIEDKGEDNPEP